jgi:hypothetical protein
VNKFFIKPLRQRFSTLFISHSDIDRWVKDWKFFFILGMGRSGTSFMADFLDHAPGAHVFHEPVLEDFYAHARAHYDSLEARRYIEGFRRTEIYTRMRNFPSGIYGETNSLLRCHAEALAVTFPQSTILHIVRDGRDVVRSQVSRGTLTLHNPFSMSMHPTNSDPWKEKWPGMDRFARLCWFWQEENRRLRLATKQTVQFEKILAGYDYFAEQVLQPCGIHIEKKDWEATIKTPRNVSKEFTMPKWDKWTAQQQQTFREICGAEMEKCGYDF